MTMSGIGLAPAAGRSMRLLAWGRAADVPAAAAGSPTSESAGRLPLLQQVPRTAAARDAAAVRVLQRALKDAGVDPGPVDGWFGPRTAAAVRLYQQRRGFPPSGQVGPDTWASFGRLEAAPPTGRPDTSVVPAPRPGGVGSTPAVLPPGSPHERRKEWFVSQLRCKYNTREDALKNGNCGPTSVTMIARAFGKVTFDAAGANEAIEETRRRMGVRWERPELEKGTSVGALIKGLKSYGLEPRRICNVKSVAPIARELAKGNLVLAWMKGHYIVVTKVENGKVYTNDPVSRTGPTVRSVGEFLGSFMGAMLTVRNPAP